MNVRPGGLLSDLASTRCRWIRLLAATLLLFPLPAVPATIVVDDPTCGGFMDGKCSLYEAIDNANSDADNSGGDCEAGDADPDTIRLTTDVVVSCSPDDVVSQITVEGNGFTVDANGYDTAFTIRSGAKLILNQVTVTGAAEDGICNEGTVELIDSLVTLNHRGISNEGDAKLTNTTVSYNDPGSNADGGGIDNDDDAELTLMNSAISHNKAGWGGGIFINGGGTVIITNSTISDNEVLRDGGGLSNYGMVSLTNVTLSGNSAGRNGGGIYQEDDPASMTLTNVTLSGNEASLGGGIYNEPDLSLTLINSIVANSPDGGNCVGVTSGIGKNFDDDGTCPATQTAGLALGPLADNGGPTETHALLPGSAAIDAVPAGQCVDAMAAPITNDQRGAPRPVDGDAVAGALCDSGAYEFEGAMLVTLESFSASPTRRGVLLSWTTALEIDNVGFRVLRGVPGSDKSLVVLTPELIPARGANLVGADYEFLDRTPRQSGAIEYYLEDVDAYGRTTRHGPVVVELDGTHRGPRTRQRESRHPGR